MQSNPNKTLAMTTVRKAACDVALKCVTLGGRTRKPIIRGSGAQLLLRPDLRRRRTLVERTSGELWGSRVPGPLLRPYVTWSMLHREPRALRWLKGKAMKFQQIP